MRGCVQTAGCPTLSNPLEKSLDMLSCSVLLAKYIKQAHDPIAERPAMHSGQIRHSQGASNKHQSRKETDHVSLRTLHSVSDLG